MTERTRRARREICAAGDRALSDFGKVLGQAVQQGAGSTDRQHEQELAARAAAKEAWKANYQTYLENESENEKFLAMNRFPEGSPSHLAYEHIRDNWMHMDTGTDQDDSIDFDDEEAFVQQESGPSEFDQWLEDYDKKYEDPTLEAAERRKADNESFLSL